MNNGQWTITILKKGRGLSQQVKTKSFFLSKRKVLNQINQLSIINYQLSIDKTITDYLLPIS